MFIDSHCHYDLKEFDNERFSLLAGFKANRIGMIINSAILPESNESMRKKLDYIKYPELLEQENLTADELPEIYYAAGVHPTRVWRKSVIAEEDWEETILNAVQDPNVIAVGETGLDYHHVNMDEAMKAKQHEWFHRQVQIAEKAELPLIFHIRMAHRDGVSVLKTYALKEGGVVHCFDGGIEEAKEFLDMGLYLGIGGMVTLDECDALREAVKQIPLDRILLETDAPYVKPKWCGTQWNDSMNIPGIAQVIAKIKEVPAQTVEEVTTANCNRLFHIE